MSKVMVTMELDPKEATLAKVRERLRLSDEDLDPEFGLVPVDPEAHLYAVLVEEAAAERASSKPGVRGPFSNPRIESFGPPTSGGDSGAR